MSSNGTRARWRRLAPAGASKGDDKIRPEAWKSHNLYVLSDPSSDTFYIWSERISKVMRIRGDQRVVSHYNAREKPSLGSLGGMSLVAMIEWKHFDAPHPDPNHGIKQGPGSQFLKSRLAQVV